MAFVAETGFGTVGANAYGSVAGFRAYHTDRGVSGVDSGSVNDAGVQVALVKATDYIERAFRSLWIGYRRFSSLAARSVLTVSALPADGNSFRIGSVTYTFRTSPETAGTLAIAASVSEQLDVIIASLAAISNASISGADTDLASRLAVYSEMSGVVTTAVGTGVTFDRAATSGASALPQPLSWPRSEAYLDGVELLGVPLVVEQAVYEYALRALTTTLLPDPPTDATGRRVLSESTRVGPLAESRTFGQAEYVAVRPYPAADRLIAPLLVSSGQDVIR